MRYNDDKFLTFFSECDQNVSLTDTCPRSLLNRNKLDKSMESRVVHIRLNEKDLHIVDILKRIYGYDEVAPLFRYMIRRDFEKRIEENRARQGSGVVGNSRYHKRIRDVRI